MSLSSLSATHPVSVLMLYSALAVSGIISLLQLDINMYPDISIPQASVITECESMSAEDIEKMITIPVENSLSAVKGIKEISSVSKNGISSVKLTFGWNEKLNIVSGEIREKIDTVYPLLPFESQKPVLFLKNLAGCSILTLSVIPVKGKTISEISRIVETDLKSRLLAIEGVSEVKLSGLSRKEIKVDIDYPALVNTGIPLSTVTSSISSSVFSNPAGKIFKGTKEYKVRTETDIKDISDIANIIIQGTEGLKLSDISKIYMGEKERYSYFHSEGKVCIGIEIIKTGDSGLLNTIERIHRNLRHFENIFKNDFSINLIDDSSMSLKKTLRSLLKAILTGTAAAILVLACIFRNRRTVFTIIISLPLSLLAVIIFMYFTDISINIISLSGLIIGTGMVFDNTIIVIEKLIKEKPQTSEHTGRITEETVLSVTGSSITTILIFLPLLFISGLAGKLFKDLALVLIVLISASAVTAMTVPPALFMLLDLKNDKSVFRPALSSIYRKYSMRKRGYLPGCILLFTLPLFLIFIIDKEIIPSAYGKKSEIHLNYRPGFSALYYSELSSIIEQSLLESGIAETVHLRGGVDIKSLEERGSIDNDFNKAVFKVKGKNSFKGNSDDFTVTLERFFSNIGSEVKLKNNESFLDKIIFSSGVREYILIGKDRNQALSLISDIRDKLKESYPGSEISGNFNKNNPEYTLKFNSLGLSSSIMSPMKISQTLYHSIKGSRAAALDTGGEEDTGIIVRYNKKYTDTAEKISALKIPLNGGIFDTSSITEIHFEETFTNLTRYNRKPCFHINIIPQKGKEKEIYTMLSSYKDQGLENPDFTDKNEIQKEIIFLFAAALLLVYFFLGAQFESFLIPIYLMLTIPFSISGSFMLLYLTKKSLNISSFLGILILSGTTVNSAIMLFSEIKKGGFSAGEAAENRLRSILASSLTTIAALIPAALQIKNPIQSSSAVCLIGGLVSGGLSVLILYPLMFGNIKKRISESRHISNNTSENI